MNTAASILAVKVVKCIAPFAVTAEIMLIEWRAPVVRTMGVCPNGAQVVAAW